MAAPSYTTDLTTIAIGSITVDAGTWDESEDALFDDGGAMVDDGNLYYNGSACVSAQFTKDGQATILYVHTASVAIPADGAILIHHLWAAPPALATLALGGVKAIVGNSLGVFFGWNCSGSDAAPSPRGGWANYAINPAIGTPDDTVGAPASPYSTFGIAINATAQARGNPNAVNAIRYGRCTSIFEDGDSTTPATFLGFGLVDSATANKWNLIDPIDGGFKVQGLLSIGTATTAAYLHDKNISISIADTINVTGAFNAIEVHNAATDLQLDAVSITALGTTSKGTFTVVDNAAVIKNSCTFTDMGEFSYLSNSVLTSCTYRRCGLVSGGGASFVKTLFTNAAATALSILTLNDLDACIFESTGTGHAVDLGTIATDTSMAWNCSATGYASNDGSTGNEAVLVDVDAGATLTINVAAGVAHPSIKNIGLGTVYIPLTTYSITFTGLPSGVEFRLRQGSYTLAHEQNVTNGTTIAYSYEYTADRAAVASFIGSDIIETQSFGVVLGGANQVIPVIFKTDPSYL